MARHKVAWFGLAGLVASAELCIFGLALFLALPPDRAFVRGDRLETLVLTDRNGTVLREVRSSEHGVAHWAGLDSVSPAFVQAVIAAEDRRFFRHPGIDPRALVRALAANARSRRVVSGGSTITQQLVRSIYRCGRRGVVVKVGEAVEALRLERHLSKREILEAYVNRVGFGNRVYGIDAASRLYFDRDPGRLSLAQAAFLAAVLRAPARYDPYRRHGRTLERQRWILSQMRGQGRIGEFEYEAALAESVVLAPPRPLFRAPHFTDMVIAETQSETEGRSKPPRTPRAPGVREIGNPKSRIQNPKPALVRTTLDWSLQQRCEDLVERQLRRLAGNHVTNAAVVVLDVESGDVLALVGSRDYFSPDAGQVNAALSLRQPGSALKPFVYGLGFEHGLAPATVVPDLPGYFSERFGDYVPQNYDRKFHGPVSCRTALACSYNVPAVRVAEMVGKERLLERLRDCGLASLDRDAGHYGLALALGVGDVRLLELANAYRVLANRGEYRHWRLVFETPERDCRGRQVFTPQAAYLVTDVLSDDRARAPAFGEFSCLSLPFSCAVKTGTSKDYRDNWTVGYTADHVVGVWVGNFDNTPMHRVTGVTGAGPLFRDIMLALNCGAARGVARPAGVSECAVCPKSGELPGPFCSGTVDELFPARREPRDTCKVHRCLRDAGTGAERVFEVYPPEYWAWMAENGIELPPQAVTGSRDAAAGPERLAVVFPDDGDVFKLDPDVNREHQAIRLRASVPPGADEVAWVLDGRELEKVGPPFTRFWNLEPGRHRLRVEAGGRSSDEVSFLVLP